MLVVFWDDLISSIIYKSDEIKRKLYKDICSYDLEESLRSDIDSHLNEWLVK